MNKKLSALLLTVCFLLLSGGSGFAACREEGDYCDPTLNDCCSGLVCQDDPDPNLTAYTCYIPFGKVDQPYGTGYGSEGFVSFLNNVVAAVMTGAGLLLFVYLILGGIKYMTAGGDEKAVASAKRILTNAMIGLIIIAGAYFIATILEKVLGISILTPVFKGP